MINAPRYIILLFSTILALTACNKADKSIRAKSYFPDMEKSRAYKSYTDTILIYYSKNEEYPIKEYQFNSAQQLFINVCSQCHGEKGKGDGYLFTSNMFNYPPANLTSERIAQKSKNEIYKIITFGFGMMGPHNQVLNQPQRDSVANYVIKNLQGTGN